jgi:hypothetical protein
MGARGGRWTLEGLDWGTGASTFHSVLGGQQFNSVFSGVILDGAGNNYGTTFGKARILK